MLFLCAWTNGSICGFLPCVWQAEATALRVFDSHWASAKVMMLIWWKASMFSNVKLSTEFGNIDETKPHSSSGLLAHDSHGWDEEYSYYFHTSKPVKMISSIRSTRQNYIISFPKHRWDNLNLNKLRLRYHLRCIGCHKEWSFSRRKISDQPIQ